MFEYGYPNWVKRIARSVLSPKAYLALAAWKQYYTGEPELKLLNHLVDPGKMAIDIGANQGVYTYFLSRLCVHTHAFEPNPDVRRYLAPAMAGVRVTVHDVALSDREAKVSLTAPLVSGKLIHGRGKLGSFETESKEFEEYKEYQVTTATLDSFGFSNIGFIKIDVEGHELAVLNGAHELLDKERPVLLVEIERKHDQASVMEVFALLGKKKYQCWIYDKDAKKTRRMDLDSIADFLDQNLENDGNKGYVYNYIFKPGESDGN
ncbi:MAG: FkbM family methyltransferase [Nitrospinota bacterium]|nr:FkbM family methyltransferase [Nitrospinota bacterium]MDH5756623.1 FkbM family methyltransferase [Nitrospinota bacterium]